MLTAICITLIVLTIFALNIVAEVRLDVDLLKNDNAVTFFLFGIKIIKIDIGFATSHEDVIMLELSNKDKQIASLKLSDINKDNAKDTFKNALPNPFYNLDIVELEAFVELGTADALKTVAFVMAIKWGVEAARLLISASQRVKVLSYVKPNFDRSTIIVNLSGIFSITIADIIYGIILGKRREKQQ